MGFSPQITEAEQNILRFLPTPAPLTAETKNRLPPPKKRKTNENPRKLIT